MAARNLTPPGFEKANFFVRQRGGVLQSLAYIFVFELRVLSENFAWGHSVGNQIDDKRDRDAHPADTGASSHDRHVERDPVKHAASLPVDEVVQDGCGEEGLVLQRKALIRAGRECKRGGIAPR